MSSSPIYYRTNAILQHDHVILAVAQALGIISEFDGRKPEFSSAIAIETWSSSEGFDIKVC